MSHWRPMRRRAVVRSSWMVGASLLSAFAYRSAIRPRLLRWGATDEELQASMPGDEDVQRPSLVATRAVTINAPPSAVWPWIVQIGYHRAGWYSYDLFDNDDIPSAESILPEFQQLEIGQVIGEEGNAVREIVLERHLLLGFHNPRVEWVFKQGVWPKFGSETLCLQLKPTEHGQRTRLVYRVRVAAPPMFVPILVGFFEPADFVASRKMLTGIKRRAETAASMRPRMQPIVTHEVGPGGSTVPSAKGRTTIALEAARLHSQPPKEV